MAGSVTVKRAYSPLPDEFFYYIRGWKFAEKSVKIYGRRESARRITDGFAYKMASHTENFR